MYPVLAIAIYVILFVYVASYMLQPLVVSYSLADMHELGSHTFHVLGIFFPNDVPLLMVTS